MSLLASIVGYLGIGAVALSVIAVAVWYICAAIDSLLKSRSDDAYTRAMNHMAGRLITESRWFSEDSPTMWLLGKIAQDITTHGWSDVSTVREEWRKRRAAEESGSLNQKK